MKIASLSALAGLFDAFFVDQFGVLHDGAVPYPGAIEALQRLKDADKQVVLISNSGKRADVNEDRLSQLGFRRSSYDHFLTSGEVAWRLLNGAMIGKTIARQSTCFLISRDANTSAVDGLDLKIVDNAVEADIILLSGCRDDVLSIEEYETMLAPSAQRGVLCICTNPDKFMIMDSGLKFAAGAIAERYADLGGPVNYIGKPYPEIYSAALALLGNPDEANVVCIGDSVEHDIAGGHRAGLKTALVRAGVSKHLDQHELDQIYTQHHVRPDFVLPHFMWK